MLHVEQVGWATIQDLGRPGLAHIGVPRSGAADRSALRLANRLVGNDEGAAAVEVLLGGLVVSADRHMGVAVTGAAVPITGLGPDGRVRRGHAGEPMVVLPGERLRLGMATRGVRAYLAVRGGIAAPSVLGSQSYDTLSRLGPPPLRVGSSLPIGSAATEFPGVDLVASPEPLDPPTVRIVEGPRWDWFAGSAWSDLLSGAWVVDPRSDRVGTRLLGPVLARREIGRELPSEGMVRGAVQVPPSGLPVILGADHPVTGGYPVIGVVVDSDIDVISQLRPGDSLRFRHVPRNRLAASLL